MSIDIPTSEELAELTRHRAVGSVSLYVATAPGSSDARAAIVHDSEAARLALRTALSEALEELKTLGVSHSEREAMSQSLRALESNRDFWGSSARTVAVFLAPDSAADTEPRAFRLMNELPAHTAVGDRFDVGPLVRATTFDHSGYVLAVTESEVRLVQLTSDASHQVLELPTLPDDVHQLLETSDHDGRFDRRSAEGSLGPKPEQRKYAKAVHDAVADVIGDHGVPLVLAAASDLEPAYRQVNSYRNLLERSVDANPASLSTNELVSRGRAILTEHYAESLATWREDFGSRRANGRATSQLSEVARAATAGLVDTLLFDLASTEEGTIDEAGALTLAPEPGPTTYGIVDELAARVLRTGGTVKAVRAEDLPDEDSPVAATLRGPA